MERREGEDGGTPWDTSRNRSDLFKGPSWVGEKEGKKRGNASRPADATTFKCSARAEQRENDNSGASSSNLGATLVLGMGGSSAQRLATTQCRMFPGRPPTADRSHGISVSWPAAQGPEVYNWHRAHLKKPPPSASAKKKFSNGGSPACTAPSTLECKQVPMLHPRYTPDLASATISHVGGTSWSRPTLPTCQVATYLASAD